MKADGKYDELKKAGTWGKSSEKDEQIIALTARIETLQKEVSKGKGPSSTSSSTKGAGKYAWKYDRSLSASATYVRDGKTFKWCTGPGHNKKAMWVSGHEPGKCTADYKGGKSKGGNKSSPPESATRVDRTALNTMLKNYSPGLTGSELDSKVQALLSVLESLWGRLRGHFVCACRLIWELAWLIGVWLWLEIILFMAIPIYPEVEIEEDSLSPCTLKSLPLQPRRPPIPIMVIPDCYFVLSDIRLKMSFLLLFKHHFEAETLAAERLRVIQFGMDPCLWAIVHACGDVLALPQAPRSTVRNE